MKCAVICLDSCMFFYGKEVFLSQKEKLKQQYIKTQRSMNRSQYKKV